MTFADTIDLRDESLNLAPPVAEAKRRFREMHPGSGRGFPSKFDYRRHSVAYSKARKGGAVLDVGVGSGQLVNALALGGEFRRVCGIDIAKHTKYERFTDAFERRTMSVVDMSFAEGEFDVVICMEVLEHLEPDEFARALREIRRVCGGQVLASVPYDEPEPLPSYHKIRFGDEELARHFPGARLTLLEKPRVPWVLIEERV